MRFNYLGLYSFLRKTLTVWINCFSYYEVIFLFKITISFVTKVYFHNSNVTVERKVLLFIIFIQKLCYFWKKKNVLHISQLTTQTTKHVILWQILHLKLKYNYGHHRLLRESEASIFFLFITRKLQEFGWFLFQTYRLI